MRRTGWDRRLRALTVGTVALVGLSSAGVVVWAWAGGDGSTTSARANNTTTITSAPAKTGTPSGAADGVEIVTTTTLPLLDTVAFLGDSLAVNLGEAALSEVQVPPGGLGFTVAADGISGCGVARSGGYRIGRGEHALSSVCAGWPSAWRQLLQRDRPKVVVLQLGRHEVLDRQLNDRWANILEPTYAAYVRAELELAVSIASQHGAKVVLLTAPIFRGSSTSRAEDDPQRVERFNELLREVASGDPQVDVIDLGGRASPRGVYEKVVDGIAVRDDGVHYSRAGASWAVAWLLPQLSPLVGQTGR